MMKALIVLLAICNGCQSLIYKQLYPFDIVNDHAVERGDSVSSPLTKLQWPVIFYDNVFNGVSVHSDGFLTLEVYEKGEENTKEAVIAPFMLDLDSTIHGGIYYQEHMDKETLDRATGDVRKAFEESAIDFDAESALVVTWDNLQSSSHPAANFTFQCIIASDVMSSFAIFLYPNDEFALSPDSEETRNGLSGRAGFNDRGRDELEVLSANELLEGGNANSPGEWIFQIGGVMLSLEGYEEPAHHIKEDSVLSRRDSGFEVSEVNFNEDYNPDSGNYCGSQICNAENAQCHAFADANCCQCQEGYFGNGVVCIENENAVRYNGRVTGHCIVMNEDNSWSNETANIVDLHSYVVTKDGRAFSVMNGDLSPELSRALQPMFIISSTLGWIFARATSPAINGFQMSGGKITSDTYIRYTTGAYEFSIRQVYDEIVDDESGTGKVLNGRMEFTGRLPAVGEGDQMSVDDYSQIYTKTGPGTIRSRETRSYSIGDITHSYIVDQTIQFEGCEASFEQVPDDQTVDVSAIYIDFIETEANLRYAMNNHIKPAGGEEESEGGDDSVGVRPTDAPERIPEVETREPEWETREPEVETREPEVEVETNGPAIQPPISQTVCERQLAEATRLQENPNIVDEVFFPTCTDIGTFAPRQCTTFDSVCWCVDEDTGVEIQNTRTEQGLGYNLDCSDVLAPPPALTPCEDDRSNAEIARNEGGSAANSIFMPRCMESGAYEPLQQLPDGSFMCVDFDGEELSRSVERPECMTACQLKSYIAETSNIFRETEHFVVACTSTGEYNPKQCVERYCFCVDKNGFELGGSRVETSENRDAALDCVAFNQPEVPVIPTEETPEVPEPTPEVRPQPPVRPQPSPEVTKLIFAQSMGINVIELPVTRGASARRLFARSDQTAVALAYDCANKVYYWTDVSKRIIYSSEINGDGSRNVIASERLRSPEGIAVDFLSGNVYWTDSEYDRIEVARADGSNRMTLVTGEMSNPRGIAVDPFRGQMYWTDWNRSAPKVWMADMDGSNKRVIVSNDLKLPNDITIDFYYQKVCFIDAGTKRVDCMNLDGSGRETVYSLSASPIQHPFGLAVDGDTLFYSTWRGSKVVHAVNWRTGNDIPITGPRGAHGQMYGVAVVHSQCPRGYNHCMNNNGGCPQLCLPTPAGRECK